MKLFSIFSIILLFISIYSFSQESNGRINSLVAAENYLSALAKKNGSKEAFLKVAEDETLIFRPDMVKVKDFFDKMPKISKDLDFKCGKCGHEEKITVEGLESFFV